MERIGLDLILLAFYFSFKNENTTYVQLRLKIITCVSINITHYHLCEWACVQRTHRILYKLKGKQVGVVQMVRFYVLGITRLLIFLMSSVWLVNLCMPNG